MAFRIDTVSASGRIVAADDNAVVLVIEFHARHLNAGAVYVGGSDVAEDGSREIPPGESFTLNFALPDVGRHAGRVLLSQFYAVVTGDNKLDWSAITRDPAS